MIYIVWLYSNYLHAIVDDYIVKLGAEELNTAPETIYQVIDGNFCIVFSWRHKIGTGCGMILPIIYRYPDRGNSKVILFWFPCKYQR